MFALASVAVAITAVSSVSALVVPRATAPVGWATAYLEPYDTYHTRYMAIGCNNKHNSAFFDQCCHPLLATDKLETARPKQCIPSTSASSSVSAVNPTSTAALDDGDEYNDCDDDDDESFPVVATPTKASAAPAVVKASPAKAATKPEIASSNNVNSGGFATYFYQNGIAGACGTVHSDKDMIAAIDGHRYGNLGVKSGLCGKKVQITNPSNKKSVTVTIADACPTCKNSNSIDLSEAAFKKIATLEQGMVGITWSFV
ncbi:hypothetical protein D9615_004000 [Tricholomella constricta]|uniref:RlpA-like protein double-psi beta-barrel domain-containing protein n=1 Tax=Tricholomella constricta TaxID=117010 RepID=A0A8H5M4G9_9AGAR|nr:hypothetical protein D9615_004000 [Tricholomella constricta]